MLKSISRTVSLAAIVLLVGAGACMAHPLSGTQRSQVRHAARAYASTVDPTHASVRCHRWHCQVHQVIDSGTWTQWTVVYRVNIRPAGNGRLAVSSPMFRGYVYVHIRH